MGCCRGRKCLPPMWIAPQHVYTKHPVPLSTVMSLCHREIFPRDVAQEDAPVGSELEQRSNVSSDDQPPRRNCRPHLPCPQPEMFCDAQRGLMTAPRQSENSFLLRAQ